MRLIDGKGRLFGKINIFDLAVICLLLGASVLAVKWISMAEDPSYVKVKLYHTRCIARVGLQPYVADLIKAGDEMINDDGLVVAKIVKVVSNEPASIVVYTTKDGEKLFFNSEARDVTVELDLLSYKKKGGDVYSASGLMIKQGCGFSLITKKYHIPLNLISILETVE